MTTEHERLPYMTSGEAQAYLGCSREWIRILTNRDEIQRGPYPGTYVRTSIVDYQMRRSGERLNLLSYFRRIIAR